MCAPPAAWGIIFVLDLSHVRRNPCPFFPPFHRNHTFLHTQSFPKASRPPPVSPHKRVLLLHKISQHHVVLPQPQKFPTAYHLRAKRPALREHRPPSSRARNKNQIPPQQLRPALRRQRRRRGCRHRPLEPHDPRHPGRPPAAAAERCTPQRGAAAGRILRGMGCACCECFLFLFLSLQRLSKNV